MHHLNQSAFIFHNKPSMFNLLNTKAQQTHLQLLLSVKLFKKKFFLNTFTLETLNSNSLLHVQ